MLTSFLILNDMNKGAKAVGEAITGLDFATVVVNGKAYTIFPRR